MPRIKKGRKAVGAGKKKAEPQEVQMSEADSEEVETDDNEADIVDGSLSEEDGMNGNSLEEMEEGSGSEEIEKSPPPPKKVVGKKGRPKKTVTAKRVAGSKTRKSARAPVPTKKAKVEESESDDEYEVEQILETRNKKNKTKEFYVKWKGYPYSECTWEPESNLTSSQKLVSAFLAQLKKK